MDRWVDRQTMIHTHGRISLSLEKEGCSALAMTWMNLEDISQTQKDKSHVSPCIWVPRRLPFIEIESRLWGQV